jgi:hypothetical protein
MMAQRAVVIHGTEAQAGSAGWQLQDRVEGQARGGPWGDQ